MSLHPSHQSSHQSSHNYQEPEPVGGVVPAVGRLPRRTVFKWFVAVAAAMQLGEAQVFGAEPTPTAPPAVPPINAKGYGSDPQLNKFYNPGDAWPLTLSKAQRAAATALADVIIPADDLGPAASQVRVIDFLDEWVSAPYPGQLHDRGIVLPGLDWLDAESTRRFNAVFAALQAEQQKAICDDICFEPTAKDGFKAGAKFFSKFRALAGAAYYATPDGWKAIGYVGNLPTLTYDGPPAEVLAKLGVEQTVK
jgi:hypothetical protein